VCLTDQISVLAWLHRDHGRAYSCCCGHGHTPRLGTLRPALLPRTPPTQGGLTCFCSGKRPCFCIHSPAWDPAYLHAVHFSSPAVFVGRRRDFFQSHLISRYFFPRRVHSTQLIWQKVHSEGHHNLRFDLIPLPRFS